MHIGRYSSPEEFLDATASYRALDPVRTNVIGSVALAVSNGSQRYDDYWWWVVHDDDEKVIGAAIRTAPFSLQLGPMPLVALALLAREVATFDDDFPSIVGPEELVTEFLATYRVTNSTGSRRTFSPSRTNLCYEVTTLTMPMVEGQCQVATIDDFDLVLQWVLDFNEFIYEDVPPTSEGDIDTLKVMLTSGKIHLWIVDDRPVSMAGHSTPVEIPSGLLTRVGPVFTPAELRSNGYGSAITASLSEKLLAGGSRVMLYADAVNPTSNGVYQSIGYRLVDTQLEMSVVS